MNAKDEIEPIQEIEKQITAAMDNFESAIQNILKLNDQIKGLKASLSRPKEADRWKPYEVGYTVDGVYDCYPIDSVHGKFRTKELAELRAKQREAEDELFNIWESLVGDWRPERLAERFYLVWRVDLNKKFAKSTNDLFDLPTYRYFPDADLAFKQYELASDHARAYIRGEF